MWYWFGLAALALIGEALSGTFFLLLIAVALVAAGIATVLGASFGAQLAVCAVVIVAGALILRRAGVLKWRSDPSSNPDANLDIGQQVDVPAWEPDGTTRVWYRGAHWQARSANRPPQAGPHRISGIQGSWLVLEYLES